MFDHQHAFRRICVPTAAIFYWGSLICILHLYTTPLQADGSAVGGQVPCCSCTNLVPNACQGISPYSCDPGGDLGNVKCHSDGHPSADCPDDPGNKCMATYHCSGVSKLCSGACTGTCSGG